MKNALKITAMALITFAVVSNVYSAGFSYYGFKTKKLNTAIYQASTTDLGSSSGGGGTATGTDPHAIFPSPIFHDVLCGTTYVQAGETSAGTAGATANTVTNAAGQVSVSVGYSGRTGTSYNQIIPAHHATMVQCIGPNWAICSNVTAIEACR